MSAFDEFDVCYNILESLLTGVGVVGAGENFVLTRDNLPKLKEQLETWANAAWRVMQSRLDQLTQVRGFADQRFSQASRTSRSRQPPNLGYRAIHNLKSNDDKAPSDETAIARSTSTDQNL